jgi:hypothetical protein
MTSANGFLAIWSDIPSESETDYLHWLTWEHIKERLAVPGFLNVRVFRALLDSVRRYLIIYDLQDGDVLASAPYLSRLNHPTPWSQRIMPQLSNFRRGGGRVQWKAGCGQGGFIAALAIEPGKVPAAGLEKLVSADRICAISLFETDLTSSAIATAEKQLRDGDEIFAGLIVLEGLDEKALIDCLNNPVFRHADFFGKTLPRTPLYQLIYASKTADVIF